MSSVREWRREGGGGGGGGEGGEEGERIEERQVMMNITIGPLSAPVQQC